MTTLAQLRKAALAQPGTQEVATDGGVGFEVEGILFASAVRGTATLHLTPADTVELLPQESAATPTDTGVRVVLSDINGMALNYWVRRAWLAQAPPLLRERANTGADAGDGRVGDLPRELGNPATRALVGDGIDTLAALSRRTEAEVAALHGVGPAALAVLRRKLSEHGLDWRPPEG